MKPFAGWRPGKAVVLRGTGYGRLWFALPCRVVQDLPERIALYWRAGTPWKGVRQHPIGREVLTPRKAELDELVWNETDVLLLARPGEAHTTWACGKPGGGNFAAGT